MTAIEHLKRLAAARIERQRAEQPYSGPSRVWTGPRSSYLEADLREKMRTYAAGLLEGKGRAPGDPSAR